MKTYTFTEDQVKHMAENVIRQFDGTGWDYLAKQFPVVFDDKLPTMDKVNLDIHDTFSFANQYYVGFSESRALQQITDYYSAKDLELSYSELEKNVRNVLVHEYGHILLEHVFEKPSKTKFDDEVRVVTAEIETNRGIPKYERAEYFDDVIIADDKPDFETVQPYITHKAVTNEVKRLWKNHKDKQDEQQQDEQQKQQKKEPQKDECSDNGGGGDNDEQKDERGKEQQQAQEQTQQPTQPSPSPTDDKNSAQGEQKEQVKTKKPDNVGTMVQAMRDANDNAQQTDLLTELGLQASDDFRNGDIKQRLDALVELAHNNEIRKTLAKIKGSLAGELSKEKVGTYSRPSRKTGEDGLMRRGTKRGANKRPNILIALDESGSMDCTAVQTAATAIKLVAKTIGRNRSDIRICSFSNFINRKATLSNYDNVVNSYSPFGGTSFNSVIDYAQTLKADVVLCIGDGLASLPNDCGNIKWVDVLITPHFQIERVNGYYTQKDIETKRRETLWLGNNKRRVEQLASEM